MFSQEATISMADGTQQMINNIRVNDIILNKLNVPVKVDRIHIYPSHLCVGVQLNNGTGVFYCDPNVKVLCHNTENNGSTIIDFRTISSVISTGSTLKSSSKVFSPNSNVSIITYNDNNYVKDLYCIHISDSTQAFYINKVIVLCDPL